MELIWKFVGCIGSLVGPALQLWRSIRARVAWTRRAEESVGGLGAWYALIMKVPLALARFLLAVIILASLIALFAGVRSATSSTPRIAPADSQATQTSSSPSATTRTAPTSLQDWPPFLFRNSLWLLFGYFVVAVAVHFNALPWLLLWCMRAVGMRHGPGFINAHWHLRNRDSAIPLNTALPAVSRCANTVLRAFVDDPVRYRADMAMPPGELEAEDKANVWLIGHAIESQIHDLRLVYEPGFRALYGALATMAAHEDRPFSPARLSAAVNEERSVYSAFVQLAPAPDILPNEPKLEAAVGNTVEELVNGYAGQARSLADVFGISYSPRLLLRRLKSFEVFAGSEHESMRAQALKIAYCWQLWPGMEPGPFMYPFSRNVACLLLNLECMLTRPDVKAIPHTTDLERLTAWTIDQVIDAAEEIVRNSHDTGVRRFFREELGCEPDQVPRWQLCRHVDYCLWHESRESDGGCFGEAATGPWQFRGRSFVKADG